MMVLLVDMVMVLFVGIQGVNFVVVDNHVGLGQIRAVVVCATTPKPGGEVKLRGYLVLCKVATNALFLRIAKKIGESR